MTRSSDLTRLLEGVNEIAAPGLPGNLVVFGPGAFPVVVGKEGQDTLGVVVGAARFGGGRVVAFSHDGYFSRDALATADTARLMLNAIRWSGGNPANLRVALYRREALSEFLGQQGLRQIEPNFEALKPRDVLVIDGRTFQGKDVGAVVRFVRGGGGLVIAATGWGWAQLNPQQDLRSDFAGNQLLIPMGMVWGGDTVTRTTDKGFGSTIRPPEAVHAQTALQLASQQMEGRTKGKTTGVNQAIATLTAAAHSLPSSDVLFLPKIRSLANSDTHVVPTPKTPITKNDLAARLAITFQALAAKTVPPEQVRPHPASSIFPGEVPANAPRISRKLKIDATVPGWHSTGLYAPAGAVVTVAIPGTAARKGLGVLIGCHSDKLWALEKWERFPEITLMRRLDQADTQLASMFGGLIYIDVPGKTDIDPFAVKISGAVAAPYYVLGETKQTDWINGLRDAPAPWAELGCPRVIITVPSEFIRKLDDPEALVKVWDRIVELEDELAGTIADRRRPERIVCDQQISAGYMHSGYPVMAWMDQPTNFVSKESLLKGNWGIFHELGHNHQHADWTFDGTVEVTCNLFTMYVMDKLCGVKPSEGRVNLREIAKHYANCTAGGQPDFEKWKKDPFMALSLYVQLQDGFGWEPFKQTFAEYRALPSEARPKTDAEKRDQWMVRFSRIVGKNLGPLFRAWGIPISQKALAEVETLPSWMPVNFPAPMQPSQ